MPTEMKRECVKYVPTIDLAKLSQVNGFWRELCRQDMENWLKSEMRRVIGDYESLLGLLKVCGMLATESTTTERKIYPGGLQGLDIGLLRAVLGNARRIMAAGRY